MQIVSNCQILFLTKNKKNLLDLLLFSQHTKRQWQWGIRKIRVSTLSLFQIDTLDYITRVFWCSNVKAWLRNKTRFCASFPPAQQTHNVIVTFCIGFKIVTLNLTFLKRFWNVYCLPRRGYIHPKVSYESFFVYMSLRLHFCFFYPIERIFLYSFEKGYRITRFLQTFWKRCCDVSRFLHSVALYATLK